MGGTSKNRNKGFTLVELVSTIALLAIIAVISFVSINHVLNERKKQECLNLNDTIKMAVKEYVSDNRYKAGVNLDEFSGDVLVDNNYLKGEIIDPYTNEKMNPGNIKINVIFNDDKTVKDAIIFYNDEELETSICKIDDDEDIRFTGGAVRINGTVKSGQTLTTVISNTKPIANEYLYQWYWNTSNNASGGNIIDGATSDKLLLDDSHIGKYIYVVVTAKKVGYDPIILRDIVGPVNNVYTIKYHANGGSGTMSSTICRKGEQCSVASNLFVNKGRTFKGWTTNSDGSADSYGWTGWSEPWQFENGKRGIVNYTLNLYAMWEANTYTVKYNANGGSGTMESTECRTGEKCTVVDNLFVKNGYSFKGWTTKDDGTDDGYNWTVWSGIWQYDDGEYGISNRTLTLYARWEANKVYIKYNVNGGTITSNTGSNTWTTDSSDLIYMNGSILQSVFSYGNVTGDYGLSDWDNSDYLNITKTGYSAKESNEWKCLSGNCIKDVYSDSTVYSTGDFCDASTGDCTITIGVNWELNEYIINYNANGGSGTMENMTCYYNQNCQLNKNLFTYSGYTFIGWGTSATSGVVYNDEVSFNYERTKNLTLYAQWKLNEESINGMRWSCPSNASGTKIFSSYNITTCLSDDCNYTYIDGRSLTGTISKSILNSDYSDTLINSSCNYVNRYVSATAGLNCRLGATTNADRKITYPYCTSVYVVPTQFNGEGSTSNWYYGTKDGCYLSGDYLMSTNPCAGTSSGGGTGTTSCTYTCILNGVSSKSECINTYGGEEYDVDTQECYKFEQSSCSSSWVAFPDTSTCGSCTYTCILNGVSSKSECINTYGGGDYDVDTKECYKFNQSSCPGAWFSVSSNCEW